MSFCPSFMRSTYSFLRRDRTFAHVCGQLRFQGLSFFTPLRCPKKPQASGDSDLRCSVSTLTTSGSVNFNLDNTPCRFESQGQADLLISRLGGVVAEELGQLAKTK